MSLDVANYVIDMTNMPFEDGKFDYIIANHVLEHIEDEKSAILDYGQCDHVRLYGNYFKEHLQSYGLRGVVYSPEDLLSQRMIEELKVIC